ncbi:MAG: cytochrome c oxidase subunit I [Actinobacteria bacterium]|nr:cytochrome c oxidase subunit I [Actinomycetota bacterium]
MATVDTTMPKEGHELRRRGLLDYTTTTDHKKIGVLYIFTSMFFFLLAGVLALFMRAELAEPGLQILDTQTYNEFFTMHGTAMMLFFIVPLALGFANYFIPLLIGAPDVAYPRVNAFTYWLFVLGGLTAFSGFLTSGGAASFGWTGYVPLADGTYSPGAGGDLWIIGLALSGVSGTLGAVNFVATVFGMRAPGMTMFRLPIFVWNMLVVSALILFTFPVLTAALAMLFIDRNFGGGFFDPAQGGDPILWQHLFWFFGHPEVYIAILPFFGVITEILPVFSRKPLFGYRGFVLATLLIGAYSFSVWAHHMFTTGAVDGPFFSATSMLIAVPTGIKFFNWISTMWRGKIRLASPMLFAVGFLFMFLMGGVTGVFLASPPIDFATHDTYYVVAHFHYVLFGGSVFAVFAGLYYWGPKIWGRMFDERLAKLHFWLMLIGFNMTFFPMHQLGLDGMPRRYADYAADSGWQPLNVLATVGSFIMALSILVFLINFFKTMRSGPPAGDDPWDGYTLEWATSSPPPHHNFTRMPRIRSERPAFDEKHGAELEARSDREESKDDTDARRNTEDRRG